MLVVYLQNKSHILHHYSITSTLKITSSIFLETCFGASVDRWAPGTNVWSTWLNGQYNRISGTSMASPHVAGILAVRGNNSVGTNGNTSKGGYTAPNARR